MTGSAQPRIPGEVLERLEPMLVMLAEDPASLSSVTSLKKARQIHLADSLSGLAVSEVVEAKNLIDIGAGAGFPGVPLAAALPETEVTLIDSVGRKVRFIESVIARLELDNAAALHSRSEDWAKGEGRERYDVVTARAVAPLDALAELASPLLRDGGVLVAWKGEREEDGEARLASIEDRVAMELDRVVDVKPFESSRDRNIYVVTKSGETPAALPRRPGLERKRPLAG